MYKEYKGLNLPQIDKDVLEFWEANRIFEKSVEQRPEDNRYVFYEGPPSANGKPGIHHVMARTVKDLFCRYHSMKGKRVERKGGWDTHGLPIELNVEKELGITKEDIGKAISVDEYNRRCRETVMRYKDMWDDITRKMGYWVDLHDPYITFENDYIESVWWLLRQLYDKGLMYKGYTIQPYSPAAGTGLSSHELNLPGAYRDITDTSAVAQFKVKGKENEYFLAWTTTPWTLPSNTALAVGKNISYVKVRCFNRYTGALTDVILAKDRLSAYFSEQNPGLKPEDVKAGNKPIPYLEVVAEMKGAELEGIEYEQLMPYVQPDKPAFRVLLGDFVSTEDGTGIVHIAPTFGADDFKVARENDIPPLVVKDELGNPMPLVDKQGRFVNEVSDFAGRYVKDYGQEEERPVDVDIVIKLKEEDKLFLSEKYVHSYPHCWRTDKPVLYYPLDSWFIKSTAAKERMFELNQTINWKPKSTGEGRFGKWLENLQDWNLSRSRYWGTPLPIWRSEDQQEEKCIGSVEELRQEIRKANEALGLSQEVPNDLHRPYIDEIVLLSDSGKPMKRELDLIDVWFDSGAMPSAQWHYPFENKEVFEKNYPADFIAEGVDQTRGWFYTLHAIAVMVFDSVSFKNVVSNGLVLDAEGNKMSKSKGNVLDPFQVIENHSADVTRWYMMSNANPWDNLKFDIKGLEEVQRKFFGTLYNTYSFFALYANIDKFYNKEEQVPLSERPEIDRWIISLLNSLVKEVDADYADYEPTQATRKVHNFVNDNLSNWYVRLCRRRFWKPSQQQNGKGSAMDMDKLAAYQTLYECLVTVAKLMAPAAPFFADWMYRNLNEASGLENHESVHLAGFPTANEAVIDKDLEQRMDYAQRISSLALSLRKKEKIRVRQPLHKILLPILDSHFQEQVEAVKGLVLSEINVKDIEYVTDTSGILKKKIKPNFKTLGRRLGKDMKAAAQVIGNMGQEDIARIEKTKQYILEVDGNSYELTLEDFEITAEDIPGWQVAGDDDITVALDITLDEELEAEGMARDIVNRIQNIRKDKDFEVTDKIRVALQKHDALVPAVEKYGEYIKAETLATELKLVDEVADGEEIELPGDVKVNIRVVAMEELKGFNWYGNFKGRDDLHRYGDNSLLMYSLQLRYNIEDIHEEALNSLVDGSDDKKTDLIYFNADLGEAVIAQGYFSSKDKREAPSSKASDLNTAVSWLLTKPIKELPERLKSAAQELRERIKNDEVKRFNIWYSHNLPESTNVERELNSAVNTTNSILNAVYGKGEISVSSIEVGRNTLEEWYNALTIPILVSDTTTIPNVEGFEIKENNWESFVSYIPAKILYDLYLEHGTKLFSANVRDYLGSRKTDSNINNGIKNTAKQNPGNFFVYNNGITALVNNFDYDETKKELTVSGFSIVNGAQTTGALGSTSTPPEDSLKISIRYIKCDDPDTIAEIVRYNNSQNKINAPDFRSNDPIQKRLVTEFSQIKGLEYSSRRGSASDIIKRNPNMLPSVTAGQLLASFHDSPAVAYNEKSRIFDSDVLYVRFFNEQTNAKHIFFILTLQKVVEKKKIQLAQKELRTDSEESLFNFFRKRGSLIVFNAAISRSIEEIIQEKVPSKFNLQFCENYSVEQAMLIWEPIVDIVSSFSIQLNDGLVDGIKNIGRLNNALDQIKQLLAAVRNPNKKIFDTFKSKVCQR